jgi:TolB-like protein
LSYASPDAAVAYQVCQYLESYGVACWLAPRNVKAGAAYADAIVRAINEASALVLALSAGAMASEHVSREVERAASKHKQVVAFRVDAANLSAELEYFLSRSQWIDVPALGMAGALVKLHEAVGRGSASTQPNPRLDGGEAAGRSTINPAVSTAMVAKCVLVAATVVVLAIGGTLAVRFWPLKHGDAQVPAVAAISEQSIAVLPFTDMSEKKDQEYFSDGMAEEIIDLLVKIPELVVSARTSSFYFKGKSTQIPAIAKQLGVKNILEGSVRKSGDHLRVTAQLLRADTGYHLWSESYDRNLDDVFKTQDEMADAVVRR